MRIMISQVEALARQVLEEVRKAVDVPVVHDFLDRIPCGQVIRNMIEPTIPVNVHSWPVKDSESPVPSTKLMEPVDTVVAEDAPSPKAPARSDSIPPVPVGTPVRMLTGAFKGWTGPLRWSPAKSAYNVKLTGPDGKQTRTTLSPSRLGTSWEVVTEATSTTRAAKPRKKGIQG